MTYQTNRKIPAAAAIDDFQDTLAERSIRAPRDFSGPILLALPVIILVGGMVAGLAQRVLS